MIRGCLNRRDTVRPLFNCIFEIVTSLTDLRLWQRGDTPLAVVGDYREIADSLISHGALINLVGEVSSTP